MGINTTAKSDINWVSLPFHSTYSKLSDIGNELGYAKVSTVGRWDVPLQKFMTVTWNDIEEIWEGDTATLTAGTAIFLDTNQNFPWSPAANNPS